VGAGELVEVGGGEAPVENGGVVGGGSVRFIPVEAQDGAKAVRGKARRRSSFGGFGVAKKEVGRGRVHADS